MENGIVVGLQLTSDNETIFKASMSELEQLGIACNINVVSSVIQKSSQVYPKHYIGTGKINDIKEIIDEHDVKVVIFNHELTASQIRNLEAGLKVAVMDRTSLIIRIFSERASSKEAKLQVEIAKLQYALPRLIGANLYLDRQGGGSGNRNKGLGETKLELDRRHIIAKISFLKKELEKVQQQRNSQRSLRNKSFLPKVSLVGYTNSGKSTVMNTLLKMCNQDDSKLVLEKNMLFATLDTNTRLIDIKDFPPFILSDTVGFVSELPHNLVEAFKSTLEEVCQADVLLHIIDVSHPDYYHQMDITTQTLDSIGASKIPMINIYNKIDCVEEGRPFDSVAISAKNQTNMDAMLRHIVRMTYKNHTYLESLIPFDELEVLNNIKSNHPLMSFLTNDDGFLIKWMCPNELYQTYKNYSIKHH